MNSPDLHAVTLEEAETLALRQRALTRFRNGYSRNDQTLRAMNGSLHRLSTVFSQGTFDEETFPWEILVDEDMAHTMWSSVAARYAKKTAARDGVALRRMLRCCHRVGLLTYQEYQHARSFEAKGGRNGPQAGHYLSEDDLAVLARACRTGTGSPVTRARDTALVLVLASSGARGFELTGVDLADTHLPQQRLWLTRTKSGEERNAWLHPVAVEALAEWLEIRGDQPGSLLVPLSRTRPLVDHGEFSTFQLWKVIRQRGAEAGLGVVTPHDLRRFAITTMLEHGVDLALVARTVGHKDPATTAGYDRRPEQFQRAAVTTIQLPTMASLGPLGRQRVR